MKPPVVCGVVCGAFFVCFVACTPRANGGSDVVVDDGCASDRDCASGVCDKSNDGDDVAAADDERGVCVVFTDDCRDDADCGDGVCAHFFCDFACEAPAARGEECFVTTDTPRCEPMTKTCAADLVCAVVEGGFGSTGTCVPVVDRALGEGCADDAAACADGLVCDRFTLCRKPVGAACAAREECSSSRCVDAVCAPDDG